MFCICSGGGAVQLNVVFNTYIKIGSETFASFFDPVSGEIFCLSKQECENRIKNLEKNSFSAKETAAAIAGWPD